MLDVSDKTFRLHTEGLCWSNRMLTDGQLAKDDMRRWAHRPGAADELVDVGWWEDRGEHYQLIHHIGYQRTKKQIANQSIANAKNANRRWSKKPSPNDSQCDSQAVHRSRTNLSTTLRAQPNTRLHCSKRSRRIQRRSAMIKTHTRTRNFLTKWSLPVATAIVVAGGAGVIAFAPPAEAQPPGTLCGHVENSLGVAQPVIVLNGDPDCMTAVQVASDYVTGPRSADGGTLQLQNVDGWQCYVPLLPGRSHADSYLECDQSGSGFKIGN